MDKKSIPLGNSFSNQLSSQDSIKVVGQASIKFEKEDEQKLYDFSIKLKNANLTDNLKFKQVAKTKEVVQEILRVILKDDNLEVIGTIEEKEIDESFFHGVVLDCFCKLSSGEFANVEMQFAFMKASVKRMRYNQSAITIAHSPKDKDFDYDKIPNIISIMLCDFDLFGLNEPIYEIKRHVNDTDIICDNGVWEIYVNMEAHSDNEKLNELFKIIKEHDYYNEQSFPNLTKVKKKYNLEEGEKKMEGLAKEIYTEGIKTGERRGEQRGLEQGIEQGLEQGEFNMLRKLYSNKLVKASEAAELLNITTEEFLNRVNTIEL